MARKLSRPELIDWIRRHAGLEKLCEMGGWPDIEHAQVDICSQDDREWIVNVTVTEAIRHISECEVSEYSRCGKYAVATDRSGKPCRIRLLYPM